jgi:serine/threonine-protein kinase HipA
MKRCLSCYLPLNASEIDFHEKCSKSFFGEKLVPDLSITEEDLKELALKLISHRLSITGVQPKLSVHLSPGKNHNERKRFTIIGLLGDYILKPQSDSYLELPENEDLTMNLAAISKIQVVPHSLIRTKSRKLAYITKRIDRLTGTARKPASTRQPLIETEKRHMEDMCQLTERLSENKYHGSYEQIAKVIKIYSSQPGLDLVNFAEIILFSFLTGNADMHLKNFSLIYDLKSSPVLAPAYDLLCTKIVNPIDDEDLALSLNGKKKKIKINDFKKAFTNMGLDIKQQENIFKKFEKSKNKWLEFIEISFLSEKFKCDYKELVQSRFERFSL